MSTPTAASGRKRVRSSRSEILSRHRRALRHARCDERQAARAVDARRADEVEYAPFPGTADTMEHLYDYLEFLAKAATVVVAIDRGDRRCDVDGPASWIDRRRTSRSSQVQRPTRRHESNVAPGVSRSAGVQEVDQAGRSRAQEGVEEQGRLGRDAAYTYSISTAICRHRRWITCATKSPPCSRAARDAGRSAGAESRVRAAWCTATALRPRNSSACDRHKIRLVTAVDKVAASGGYLMASVSDHIIAAPFALVGSIGVVAQIPNVHRLLKKHDVDVEVLTAGKYKRTLTIFGENTEQGRAKFVEELEDVHALFQEFVQANRPQVSIDEIATGEAWYGRRALGASVDRRIVDERCVSDEGVR